MTRLTRCGGKVDTGDNKLTIKATRAQLTNDNDDRRLTHPKFITASGDRKYSSGHHSIHNDSNGGTRRKEIQSMRPTLPFRVHFKLETEVGPTLLLSRWF